MRHHRRSLRVILIAQHIIAEAVWITMLLRQATFAFWRERNVIIDPADECLDLDGVDVWFGPSGTRLPAVRVCVGARVSRTCPSLRRSRVIPE